MIDPATAGAVITGLVTSLTSYMKYRIDLKQAEQQPAIEVKSPTT